MTEILTGIMIIALLTGGYAWVSIATRSVAKRHVSPLEEFLEPALSKHGFTLLSSTVPSEGVTGPYPAPGGSDASGKFNSTWPWEFRIVWCQDGAGHKHETWARLFFSSDRSFEIDWNPELDKLKENAEQAVGGYSVKAADGLH